MSMTITVDASAAAFSNGVNLRVKVLTNAAATQSGASATSSTAEQKAITTTVLNSQVYGAALNNNTPGLTTINGTSTAIDAIADATNHVSYGSCKQTTPGATGSKTIGWTNSLVDGGIALYEVLPNGTITEDASAPAVVTITNAKVATSASFTPPAGSLLVVMASALTNGTFTIADSSGLSWTQKAVIAVDGTSSVWIARVPDVGTGSINLKKMGVSASGNVGILLTNNAEGGTNGTTVSTANTGGSSGNAFDAIAIGTAAALTFDNTQSRGGLSYKVATGSPAANAIVEWTTSLTGTSVTKVWFRVYAYITSHTSQLRLIGVRSGATTRANIALDSSGHVQLLNAAGTAVKTTTTIVPLNQWFRLEGFIVGDASVGQIECKVFTTSADALTPDETQTTSAAQNTGGTITRIEYGNPSSIASYTFWMEDLAVSTAGYQGPTRPIGTGSVRIHKMVLAGVAVETDFGTGSVHVHKLSLAGSGTVKLRGTGSVHLKKMGVSGSGFAYAVGTGSVRIHKLGLAGSGTETDRGTGSVHLKKMGVSGSGTVSLRGTGSVHIHKMVLAGTAVETDFGTGSVALHKLTVSGSGQETDFGTGSVRLHKLALAGSGAAKLRGTGSVHIHKIGLAGSGAVKLQGTGSVGLKKMGLSGIGTETITITNNAEGGTNGTTVTTGNSGGTSGIAFDAITINPTAALTFDNVHSAHGGLAYKLSTGGTAGQVYAAYAAAVGTQTKIWFRLYLYFTANPASIQTVFGALAGTTACARISVSSSGKLQALNAAGSAIFTQTGAIPLNQWFRVEGFITGSASVGQVEVKRFNSLDSVTSDETTTSTAVQNTLSAMDHYRYGHGLGSSIANLGPWWMDDVGLSTAGYLGPVGGTDTGTGSVHIHKLGLAGSGVAKLRGTGSVHIHKLSLSGTAKETDAGTGSVHMHKMGISGTGTGHGFGSIRIHKMGLSGAGRGTTSGPGSVAMHKMHISGVGTETTPGTGSVHMHKMKIHARNNLPASSLFVFTSV